MKKGTSCESAGPPAAGLRRSSRLQSISSNRSSTASRVPSPSESATSSRGPLRRSRRLQSATSSNYGHTESPIVLLSQGSSISSGSGEVATNNNDITSSTFNKKVIWLSSETNSSESSSYNEKTTEKVSKKNTLKNFVDANTTATISQTKKTYAEVVKQNGTASTKRNFEKSNSGALEIEFPTLKKSKTDVTTNEKDSLKLPNTKKTYAEVLKEEKKMKNINKNAIKNYQTEPENIEKRKGVKFNSSASKKITKNIKNLKKEKMTKKTPQKMPSLNGNENIENITLSNGQTIPQRIVTTGGDGACLFRSISHILYKSQNSHKKVREEIVQHVMANWLDFQPYTHDDNTRGDNFATPNDYYLNMINPHTFGAAVEIKAASEIYNLTFEIYRNGVLYATYTNSRNNPVKRLRYSGPLDEGHFEPYENIDESETNVPPIDSVSEPTCIPTKVLHQDNIPENGNLISTTNNQPNRKRRQPLLQKDNQHKKRTQKTKKTIDADNGQQSPQSSRHDNVIQTNGQTSPPQNIINHVTPENEYVPGSFIPPRLPVQNILGPMKEPTCISTGDFHQGQFDNRNVQCVVMSCTAITLKENLQREFSKDDINNVLNTGNTVYSELVDGRPRLLYPEEVVNVTINNSLLRSPDWVDNGAYPKETSEDGSHLDDMVARLHYAFSKNEDANGFLFTGLGTTVSMWPKRTSQDNDYIEEQDRELSYDAECYYLFNSHAVNENNEHSNNDNENKARLFKVPNLRSLANLLTKNAQHIIGSVNNYEYTIHSVKINLLETNSLSSISTTNSQLKRKRGRPLKKKRGPPKTKENTEAVRKYAAKRPEVNRQNSPSQSITNHATPENEYVPGSFIPPRLPVQNILGPMKEPTCISTGDFHQGQFDNNRNVQCVVMSCTAITLKENLQREFSKDDINNVLNTGNTVYSELVNGRPRLLYPEEVVNVTINNSLLRTPDWVDNGAYPKETSEDGSHLDDMVARLHYAFSKNEHANGFLFTGLGTTVSMWPKRTSQDNDYIEEQDRELSYDAECYYLFNSHAVNKNNEHSHNDNENKARLFKVPNLRSLANLLTKNAQHIIGSVNNYEYTIHSVKINLPETDSLSSISTTDSQLKRKQGRPLKKKRGPPKTKENAHADAVRKYAAKRPEVNRAAVQRYAATHPEINRASVQIYAAIHPEARRTAVQTYAATHPEVNRAAVQTYAATHPEVNQASVERYRTRNVETVRQSNREYNAIRTVPRQLRRVGLICALANDGLNNIETFKLATIRLCDAKRCNKCQARLFNEELGKTKWCCGNGRDNILNLPPIDEAFYNNNDFIKKSRAYNNSFSFSALGMSGGYVHPNVGISFIRIQGKVYHTVNNLNVLQNKNFALCINDDEERTRIERNQYLDRTILIQIKNYLNEVNPFINVFKRLSRETTENAHLVFKKTTRRTHGNILGDMPRGEEVSAIISNDTEYRPKSIAVWRVGDERPHRINMFHNLYEAFQYPLLYPHGGAGWSLNTKNNEDGKLSQLNYYKCLLLSEERFSTLGRLSEEWMVDMFCRVEEERLKFFNRQQGYNPNNIRTATAEEITAQNANAVPADVREDETVIGEGDIVPGRIYLPSTFTGGPRYMKTKYMDGIALVSRLGKPSYFLTFTCNKNWPEIKENTADGLMPSAAVCSRVFNLKLAQLIKDLQTGRYLGNIVYMMYVIEFQKRGLPHAHICLRVEGGGPVQTDDIDTMIRADIPSEQEGPRDGALRAAVLKHMIHGPCGRGHRTDLPCWDQEKQKCQKRFPKLECDTTHVDSRGFINLRRNAQNKVTRVGYRNVTVELDDTWVVPYNAALLLRYDCHFNVEIASTRRVVKYLFKYLTKGPDETRVAVVPDDMVNNEVEQFVTRRYVGSCEAAWRLLEFHITHRKPSVIQLHVHLEGQHRVYFRHGEETEAVDRSKSDLIIYFNRPTTPEFDNLRYVDFHEQYRVSATRPTTRAVPVYGILNDRYFVFKRQVGERIARLFWVPPTRGEQFYLRLLLSTYPCRGYADLIALGGPNCISFQEAAKVVGLANDELEYDLCLQEASAFYTGHRLRRFYVLLITCGGAPAALLWDKFKASLAEDILERHPDRDVEESYNEALIHIGRLLRRHGSRLEEHGLPAVRDNTTELSRERHEYNLDTLNEFVSLWEPRLSNEQKNIYEHVKTLLTNTSTAADRNNRRNNAIFVDGPSGTGKTLLLQTILNYTRGVLNKVALCVASSGIAAQNYEGGFTAHSMFGFPLDISEDTNYWNITNGSQRAELIREASLIIYDEAPMSHKYLIHILDRSLRDLMQAPEVPFGGKIIIFAGDFRQIPPVVIHARCNDDIIAASLKSSPLWPEINHFSLSIAQRTISDNAYSDFLLSLGSGQLETVTAGEGRQRKHLIVLNNLKIVTALDDLINFVFPNNDLNTAPDECAKRAILSSININVKQINDHILERVDGEYRHLLSVDYVDDEYAEDMHFAPDILNRVQAKGVPDHDIAIKVGCVCMIIRNLNFHDRLVNGTKVIITNITPRLLYVRKPNDMETYLIPRINFKLPLDAGNAIEINRRQFPLQVCYAMTVHKSQGQTIEKVGVDLRSDVFSHGQLYVALGRVRNSNDIMILTNSNRINNESSCYANNVVIQELIN